MRLAPAFTVAIALTGGVAAAQEQISGGDDFDLPAIPEAEPDQAEPLLRVFIEPSVGLLYQSNPLRAVDGAEEDDFQVIVSPKARLALTGDEVQGELTAGIELGRSFELDQNNYVDAEIRARGRWLIDAATTAEGDLRVRRDHNAVNESTGDVNTAASEVTKFYDTSADAQVSHDLGGLTLTGIGRLYYINFEEFTDQAGGLPAVFNDDRDRVELTGGLRGDVPLGPRLGVFAEVSGDRRSYFEDIETVAFDRSSTGFRGLAGLTFESLSGNLRFEWGAGAEHRVYDAEQAFGSDTDPVFYFDSDYRIPQAGLRIRQRFDSGIRETDTLAASNISQYRYRLDVTKALAHGFEIGAGFDYEIRDFETINAGPGNPDRTDKRGRINVSLRKTFLESFYAEGRFVYELRESDEPTAEFDSLSVLFSIGAAFD